MPTPRSESAIALRIDQRVRYAVALAVVTSLLAACGGRGQQGGEPAASAPAGTSPGPAVSTPMTIGAVEYPAGWDTATEDAPVVSVAVAPDGAWNFGNAELVPGAAIPLPNELLFASDSDVLSAAAVRGLADLADYIAAQLTDSMTLEVHGWTDDRGTAAHNLDLAQRRANAVMRQLLMALRALEGRLRSIGHGEDDPLRPDPACTGDCAANRQVTVLVTAG